MNTAIEDLSCARLIEHEVGDQIAPDRVRAEEGKEDAEEQTDGHLRRLLLVLGMVTSQMIEIGRLGGPEWSRGQTDQSSTCIRGEQNAPCVNMVERTVSIKVYERPRHRQRTRLSARVTEDNRPAFFSIVSSSLSLTDIHEWGQRFDIRRDVKYVADLGGDDRPFDAEKVHADSDENDRTELQREQQQPNGQCAPPPGVSTYDEEGVGNQERVHSDVAFHVQTRLQRGHPVVRREHENERDGDDEQILVDLPERKDRLGINSSSRSSSSGSNRIGFLGRRVVQHSQRHQVESIGRIARLVVDKREFIRRHVADSLPVLTDSK